MAQQTDHIGDTNKMVTMKLYTEEQVKEIYFKGIYNGRLHIEGKCSDEINSLTPIELPSDEEILQEAYSQRTMVFSFTDGAKYILNIIQIQ